MAGTRRTVPVELGDRSYDIHIGAGSLKQTGEIISPLLSGGKILVIADATVAKLHGQTLLDSLQSAGLTASLTTFAPGEPNKTVTTAEGLWAACAEAGIDRSGAIVALGGGISGDTAGFIAATWMRGIDFIQIPTTLLAMVDSSVGGKTGVNSAAGKNLIGAFKQPRCVIIDPELLQTMPGREYRAGLAEVVKYGVIKDPDFFVWQEEHAEALANCESEAVTHAVAESCRIKAWHVQEDEFEHGVRAHLNYGHTFGHALERETGYTHYLHGEAISIGMQMAVDCAQRLGVLKDQQLAARQTALLTRCQLPLVHACTDVAAFATALTRACGLDKKARAGKTRFVLPEQLGDIHIITGPDSSDIEAACASCLQVGS